MSTMKSPTDKSRPQMFQEVQIWTRTADWATICMSFWASCPNNKIPALSRCYGQSLMYMWSFVQYTVTKLVFVSNYWGISWSTTSSSHVFTILNLRSCNFFSGNFLWGFFFVKINSWHYFCLFWYQSKTST